MSHPKYAGKKASRKDVFSNGLSDGEDDHAAEEDGEENDREEDEEDDTAEEEDEDEEMTFDYDELDDLAASKGKGGIRSTLLQKSSKSRDNDEEEEEGKGTKGHSVFVFFLTPSQKLGIKNQRFFLLRLLLS